MEAILSQVSNCCQTNAKAEEKTDANFNTRSTKNNVRVAKKKTQEMKNGHKPQEAGETVVTNNREVKVCFMA